MGYSIIISDNDTVDIDALLESLMILYSESEETFYKEFNKLHKDVKLEFKKLSENLDEYEDTQYEDTAEMAFEIVGYHTSYKKKLKKIKSEKARLFTLRNSEDLVIFEAFLDKMIRLRDLSQKHFIQIFPKCPSVFWDKIDDLRETSFKLDRDSEEYTRCLTKCKELSFDFSELSGTNTSNYE